MADLVPVRKRFDTQLSPEDHLRYVDWANASGQVVHDPAALQWWKDHVQKPPLTPEQADYAHSMDALIKIGQMADPKKFDEAVQNMPMSTNIEDQRQPEATGKGPNDPIAAYLNYQAPATLEDFISQQSQQPKHKIDLNAPPNYYMFNPPEGQ
jgi:hypothetical protein